MWGWWHVVIVMDWVVVQQRWGWQVVRIVCKLLQCVLLQWHCQGSLVTHCVQLLVYVLQIWLSLSGDIAQVSHALFLTTHPNVWVVASLDIWPLGWSCWLDLHFLLFFRYQSSNYTSTVLSLLLLSLLISLWCSILGRIRVGATTAAVISLCVGIALSVWSSSLHWQNRVSQFINLGFLDLLSSKSLLIESWSGLIGTYIGSLVLSAIPVLVLHLHLLMSHMLLYLVLASLHLLQYLLQFTC